MYAFAVFLHIHACVYMYMYINVCIDVSSVFAYLCAYSKCSVFEITLKSSRSIHSRKGWKMVLLLPELRLRAVFGAPVVAQGAQNPLIKEYYIGYLNHMRIPIRRSPPKQGTRG